MNKQLSAFISYSHSDRDRVVPIASYLGRLGVRVWIDPKELSAGQAIVEQVSNVIANADLYIVAISPSALASAWVNYELKTALSLEEARGRPKVLPVIVAKAEIPPTIRSRLYVDMTGTFDASRDTLREVVKNYLPDFEAEEKVHPKKEKPELILTSVIFQLRSETRKYYEGIYIYDEGFTKKEVEEEAVQLLNVLRGRAYGILLKFVSASEIDPSSQRPKFPNSELTESICDSAGPFRSVSKEAVVDVGILNPDERKLNQLVSSELESLGVSKVVYSFLVSPPIEGLSRQALERLQNEHDILRWDPEYGADVKLPGDLEVSVACTDERVRLGIETKYQFQFEKRAKEFSVRQFVAWLIGLEEHE